MTSGKSPTLAPATEPSAAYHDGTIHVRVLRARNLPTMDFGKRQDPFVLVQLEGSEPKLWGTTDPAFQGGTTPEWTEQQNREIELFYDARQHGRDVTLTVEVYSDESDGDLIGIGQVNVGKVVQNKTATESEFTVRLKESLTGSTGRGEVVIQVWFGPAVRRAFRAAQRFSKLLDARDAMVSSLWSLGLHASAPLAKYLHGPIEYVKRNRKLGMVLAALIGIVSAGAAAIFLSIALPTAIVAMLTFPFWIIPFTLAAFFTSPVWVPVLLLVGMFGAFMSAVFVGLGVTSRPVRRKGAFLSSRIKHSDVGKRVVYENTE
ncbi:hypothetical protein P43SY_009847 [Pythium insidiosum]|uniref:C2 domain-containing protein n=1 Tax=Pythium insidiosum TaxID=114742 RepID=A0AAD5Q8N5_PYTIN|nr:hypothetical protein P43SY_009847 [Pythium insidiosum]